MYQPITKGVVAMSDMILKIRFLFPILMNAFYYWKESTWDVDLDEQICCSGGAGGNPENYCGCQGATHRHELEWSLKEKALCRSSISGRPINNHNKGIALSKTGGE